MEKAPPAASPDAYVAALAGWRRTLVERLRRSTLSAGKLDERIKWGNLVYSAGGPVLLIRAEDKRVLFGFWRGKRLQHLDARLKPGGKYELANLVLVEGDTIHPKMVRTLVEAAIDLNHTLGDPTAATPGAHDAHTPAGLQGGPSAQPGVRVMPRGDKSSYSSKQKRQAEHIEESAKEGGRSDEAAERIAWATVNKQTGGARGKKATKKRTARKSTAKKATKKAAKKTTGRKSAAKKSTARKSTGRKSATKKSAAKKSTARKTTGRKSAAKKAAAKKSTRKSPARKSTARKSTARKSTARKSTRKATKKRARKSS